MEWKTKNKTNKIEKVASTKTYKIAIHVVSKYSKLTQFYKTEMACWKVDPLGIWLEFVYADQWYMHKTKTKIGKVKSYETLKFKWIA